MRQKHTASASLKSIKIDQPENGYRHSIDPVLLVGTTKLEKKDQTILDLGSGCGIMPILLASRYPDRTIYGIEIQEELHRIAEKNVTKNGMSRRITLLHRDITTLNGGEVPPADLIFSNPPYKAMGSGRICPNAQRATARHEITLTLNSLVRSVSKHLKPMGRFAMIFPAQRITDLMTTLRQHRMEPRTLRMIHPRPGQEARLVLVWAIKGGGPGLTVSPPLHIYDSQDLYSQEVKAFLG